VTVQNISGVALANLVVSGEVRLSPSILNDNIFVAKIKGAPDEWRPLELVVTNVGFSGITARLLAPMQFLFLTTFTQRKGKQW